MCAQWPKTEVWITNRQGRSKWDFMKIFGYLTLLAVSVASIIGITNNTSSKKETSKTQSNTTTEVMQASRVDTNTGISSAFTKLEETKNEKIETLGTEKSAKVATPIVITKKSKKKNISTNNKREQINKVQSTAIAKRVVKTQDNEQTDELSTTQAATTTTLSTSKKDSPANQVNANIDPSLAGGGNTGLRGMLGVSGVTDFKETTDDTKNYYSQFTLNLFYDLEGGDNIGLFVPMQKDLTGEFEEKFFLDSRLSYAQNGIYKSENLIFNMRYGFLYPTTEASKVRDEMVGGIELNPTLIFPMSKLIPGLTFIYIPRFRKRFHRFTTNRAGEYLVNDTLLNIFVANYSFAQKWYVSSTLLYVSSQRYDGARTDDSYLTVQELGYNYSSKLIFNAGIMQGGNVISQQYGSDQTLEVFDKNTTEFYTGFSYAF